MESPVLANVCMGTWDARALVVVGLNRLAVESELIAVDSGGRVWVYILVGAR